MNVRDDTARGDSYAAQQLVEFFVIADGELDVAGDDARLFVIAGGVAGKLKHLGGEVLHNGGEVHGSARAHALRIVTLAQKAVDAPYGELQSRLRRPRLRRLFRRARHAGSTRKEERLLTKLAVDS